MDIVEFDVFTNRGYQGFHESVDLHRRRSVAPLIRHDDVGLMLEISVGTVMDNHWVYRQLILSEVR